MNVMLGTTRRPLPTMGPANSGFNPLSLRKTIEQAGFRFSRCVTKPLGIPFLHRVSADMYHSIPSSYFGGHIFLPAER
jgi:hypothetical protein